MIRLIMIKKFLRFYFADLSALYIVNQTVSGMVFENGIKTFLITGAALSLFSYFIKPVINILLLPINLITFGTFKWISSVIAIYVITLIVSGFSINNFYFQGFSSQWIDIPTISVNGFFAIILFSFTISIITSLINWLIK